MELHCNRREEKNSDQKVKRTGSPIESCVSMKSDASKTEPISFSYGDRDPSCLSMKRDTSKTEPISFSCGDRDPSCVSMKSDASKKEPISFSCGDRDPSCVSMKSDGSKTEPISFSYGDRDPSCVSIKSDSSKTEPISFSYGDRDSSCVSMRSDASKTEPISFSCGDRDPSCVSMKSDGSKTEPISFSYGDRDPSCVSIKSDASKTEPISFSYGDRDPSCVSMRSDASKTEPISFSYGDRDPSCVSIKSDSSKTEPISFSHEKGNLSCVSMESDSSKTEPISFSCGDTDPSCVIIKSDASKTEPISFSCGDRDPSCVHFRGEVSMIEPLKFSNREDLCIRKQSTESVMQTQSLAEEFKLQQDSYSEDIVHRVMQKHKTHMKNKYESMFEGLKRQENKTLLNNIYTQLYIIEGESEVLNEEHELVQMEKTPSKPIQGTPINCLDIFRPLQDAEVEDTAIIKLQTVLTIGIAGIGKTVSVQKFILDWAEGKVNQDIDFMIVLPYRELNLIKDKQYSLHELVCDFYPELKELDSTVFDACKVVFIFDGLDESRFESRLSYAQCDKVSDITKKSSVDVLIINLIKQELLPSSLIWITSRPAAASQVPKEYIDRVTEIQGFSDPQKEEYFRRKISDQDQAQKIISHIKTTSSLHIMCHIPIFCWISASVLQQIIKQCNSKDIPKTLTEMYSHFLLTQTNIKNEKYEEKERDPSTLLEYNRTILLKLAQLAFRQLMKGNVMFYEEDLKESRIDITEASVYSGIFTEIFREESVLYHRKVFCFVHLSFQEFLAAVYVFYCYESKNMEALNFYKQWPEMVPLDELLMGAVDKAVESQNGHLDVFLRFLLGISLESNRRLLQGLLSNKHNSSEKTVEHIKTLIRAKDRHTTDYRCLSAERCISLFLCLCEMKDGSFSTELQEYLKSKARYSFLSPELCSTLAYMLLNTELVLDELDMKMCKTSDEGYRRLFPAVAYCRRVILFGCNLTKDFCEDLSLALQSADSSVKELDLSNNDLQDSGVELLCAGLMSSHCKLETLKLAICNLEAKSCEGLGLTLQSPNCCLKELDLSNNDLQASGVKLLSAGLKSPHCKLDTLRLSGCAVTDEGCAALVLALKSNPSHLIHLDLSYNPIQSVKLIDQVKDPHYKLDILLSGNTGMYSWKPGLRQYFCRLTLDPNTVHEPRSLSVVHQRLSCVRTPQFPAGPQWTLSPIYQVLSREPLTRRCYWEVEWTGSKAAVGVANGLPSISGREVWSLTCLRDSYMYIDRFTQITLPAPPFISHRVGVYLDVMACTLSFYSISPTTHTLSHLHTVYRRFIMPLYAAFAICDVFSSVTLKMI